MRRRPTAQAPVPHASVSPDAALVHPHGERVVGRRSRGDELDVEPSGKRSAPCRREVVRWPGRASRRARGGGCRCRRSSRRPRRSPSIERPGPCRRSRDARRVVGRPARGARPPSVATRRPSGRRPDRRAPTAWTRQRMPLPLISARLPSALQQLHRDVGAVAARCSAEQPVGADAAVAVAQRARQRRRRRGCRRGRRGRGSRCPSPWCLWSAASVTSLARTADRTATGSQLPVPNHAIRGSRRNQHRWRRANGRVRATASSSASSSGTAVLDVVEAASR